jgi:hypothetical protein
MLGKQPSPKGKAPRRNQRRGGYGKRQCVLEARRMVLQQKCLELRVQGLSERAIAEQLVKDKVVGSIRKSYVHQLLTAALDQVVVPEAEKLKKLELERLDNVINGHYGNAVNGDVAATQALLACVDRRTRLLGIGQETKVSSQTLGADGKPIDPIRPVINLTIARPALASASPAGHGGNSTVIDAPLPLLPIVKPGSG